MLENQNVRLGIAFGLGLIIGIGGCFLWNKPNNGIVSDNTEEADQATHTIEGANSITVKDQTAGGSVVVDEIVLENPSWIAVRDDVNGKPGKILGARLFDKGTNQGTIELLRDTAAGTKYLIVIHKDDGNFKSFDPKTDVALLNESGAPVSVEFTTAGSPDVTATTSVTTQISL